MGKTSLTFSISGRLITNLAREKLYYNNDLVGAIDLLCSCLVSDDITKDQQLALAYAILDGSKEIVGTYPNDDYVVEDVPEDKRPSKNISSYFENIRTELEEAKKTVRKTTDKILCISDHIDERTMRMIDADYRNNYCDTDDPDRTIFGTTETITENIFGNKLLEDYMDRMTSDCDEPDYGWLFPDGTFHAVEFGDHFSWASKWLKAHDPEWEDYRAREKFGHSLDEAGDYLVSRYHAVLLHNPGLGTAFVTGDTTRLTKAQKEFLFDYYTKRNKPD